MGAGTMNPVPPQKMLVAAATVLAVFAPVWMLWPSDTATPIIDPPPPTHLVVPMRLALQGSVFDAPLFNADRTADAQNVQSDSQQAAAAPAAPPPQLVGTIIGHGGDSVALIKDTSGEAHPLRIGQDVDGWRLVAIGNGTATVDRAGDRETLALDFSNKGQPEANTAAVPGMPAGQSSMAQPAVFPQKAALSGVSEH